MSHYSIRVSWSDEDALFVATCPALGNISALAETASEAVAELEKAIELALETYEAEGWPIPQADILEEYSGQFRLRLPRSMHSWLVHEAERQGVSLNTLAVSYLSHAIGTAEAHISLTKELEATLDSMKDTMIWAMQTAIFEMTADSSTNLKNVSENADYSSSGSTSHTLKLVKTVAE